MASGPKSGDTDPTTPLSAPLGLGDGSPSNAAAQQLSLANKLLKFTIWGWFIGLFYFVWFTGIGYAVLPWWAYAVLIVGGMFASFIIGWGMVMFAGLLTHIIPGKPSLHAFSWVVFISPVIAFFAAKYALLLTVWLLT